MEYQFADDLVAIRQILGLTQSELSEQLGIEQESISRLEKNNAVPSNQLLESVYTYAFDHKIQLNRIKEMLWKERLKENHKLLFHGAKNDINGIVQVNVGRINNDFGQGFYTGEKYEQAISFISGYKNSSAYYFGFDNQNLKCKEYHVDQEWMLTIAYYRGALEKYSNSSLLKELISNSRKCDYIIAPIADNRMFSIINSFIRGEITDEQCKHCLAATNLGNQYVFINDLAVSKLQMVEKVYLCEKEKQYYQEMRSNDAKLGEDKVMLARIEYRGKGKYIDEILDKNGE